VPDYIVASALRGVISVPGRVYRPGESFPAHLVSEELLAAGSVIVVGSGEQPASTRKGKKS